MTVRFTPIATVVTTGLPRTLTALCDEEVKLRQGLFRFGVLHQLLPRHTFVSHNLETGDTIIVINTTTTTHTQWSLSYNASSTDP